MKHLTIKNIGPIKEVDIDFNKINIIMGPQSSGKSTITKVACYCTWVEKRVSLTQSFDFFLSENNFLNYLLIFHKLEGYLQEDSEIHYCSTVVEFLYKYKQQPKFMWKNRYNYIKTKISYIPAERNIVSLISDWKQVSLPNNNIRNFMADWNIARKSYTPEYHSKIECLNIEYYRDESDIDYIVTPDEHAVKLLNASSGQQSLIPLYILIEYFTNIIYKLEEEKSVEDKEEEEKLGKFLIDKVIVDILQKKGIRFNDNQWQDYFWEISQEQVKTQTKKADVEKAFRTLINSFIKNNSKKIYEALKPYAMRYFVTNYSSLFIEEPELNLFPLKKRYVLYHFIKVIQKGDKKHDLFLTTHSPYILYALNNCMLGWLVKDKISEEDLKKFPWQSSWINPKWVSIWEIENGKLRNTSQSRKNTIQDKEGLIGKNYFDDNMKELMEDFDTLLEYYDDKNEN